MKDYTTMYVIEDVRIEKYPIKRVIDSGRTGTVIQYLVGPDRIHSYTEGKHSYAIGQRFHIDPVKIVLSFFYINGESKAYEITEKDEKLKNFINRVRDENPEYFI